MKVRHVYRPPRKNRFVSTLVIVAGGALFTFLIFFIIPLMRKLDSSQKDDGRELVANIAPDMQEEYQAPEEPEPEEEEPEPEPELAENDDEISVDPIDLPDLGAGTGGKVLLNLAASLALSSAALEEGGEMDQEPTPSSTFDPPLTNSIKKALKSRGSVKVVISALIDERGVVVEAAVSKSSGIVALDLAAEKALRRWKFKPALKGGRKAKARINQPFTFRVK